MRQCRSRFASQLEVSTNALEMLCKHLGLFNDNSSLTPVGRDSPVFHFEICNINRL